MKSRHTSELIELVKKYLWSGEKDIIADEEERYICYAIILCEENEKLTDGEKENFSHLGNLISDRLNTFISYEGWLNYNHPELYSMKLYKNRASETKNIRMNLQRSRRAWLNSLAEEFRAKGD